MNDLRIVQYVVTRSRTDKGIGSAPKQILGVGNWEEQLIVLPLGSSKRLCYGVPFPAQPSVASERYWEGARDGYTI